MVAAVYSGAVSEALGGNFRDGAISEAMVHLFNHESRDQWIEEEINKEITVSNNTNKSTIGYFLANYGDMRDANTIGVDKYFHCKANCQASQMGGSF